MSEMERAKQLVQSHWDGYVKQLLQAHGQSAELIEIVGYHYISSGTHFYLHAIEDERNGIFRPSIGEPLSVEEVAAISEGVAKEGVDNCANYDPDTCDYSDCRKCHSYERELTDVIV
jgi:hypothetical protein